MDIQEEKKELIELFGNHFERMYHLPPLASRILGVLIIEALRDGITFEELVDRMNASKSSVSTNLNLLLKIGKINYYTLSGDRKKYFRPAPFSERLDNYQTMLEFEKKLIDRMVKYREKTTKSVEERCDLDNIRAYKEHIMQAEALLQKTINRFREIEETNRNKQI
jgi:DNA-binding transcriptional regulator GbsR (MarR family)